VLDEGKCAKGYECVEACPFGGVRIHPESGFPLVCDTCSGRFSCVNVCPTGAISRR
jgi:carbon-monoxide dehydrogenase iron sulfur subunit